MKRLLLFAPLVIAIGLGFFLWKGLSINPKELPSALIGKPVPQFELPWLEKPGQALTQEALKGRVSLLNVWATWCPSCRTEHPFLMELAHRRNIPIYGVDYKDEAEAAKRWLSELGNPYVANIIDEEGSLGFDLGVYGAPETYIIDKKGIIRYRFAGPLTDAIWQRDLLPVFQQLNNE